MSRVICTTWSSEERAARGIAPMFSMARRVCWVAVPSRAGPPISLPAPVPETKTSPAARVAREKAPGAGASDGLKNSIMDDASSSGPYQNGRRGSAPRECRRRRSAPSTAGSNSSAALWYTRAVSDVTAPLSDRLVLDFPRVLAGPYCTRLLADLGARVVKIERARGGDDMRKGHLQLDASRDDQSTYFTRINVGKQSVGLDLGRPEPRDVVRDLGGKADVAVENFAPGVAQRLGIDYPALAAIKPDLVYCSISGFGQTGPWRERPAFAHIIHAASGLMHLEQGELAAPRSANLQAADVLAGTHAFGAIMAALWRRARTGEGARLDVSMLEALIAADDVSIAAGLNGGEKMGAPRPGMGVYEIGGRHLALQVVGSTDLWPRLLA